MSWRVRLGNEGNGGIINTIWHGSRQEKGRNHGGDILFTLYPETLLENVCIEPIWCRRFKAIHGKDRKSDFITAGDRHEAVTIPFGDDLRKEGWKRPIRWGRPGRVD